MKSIKYAGVEQFATVPRTIDEFWSQVYSLMHEINTSVYVLLEEARSRDSLIFILMSCVL